MEEWPLVYQPPDTPQSHESADIPMATPPFAFILPDVC